MTNKELELLLLILSALLVAGSLYTVWLWLNLQITRRVINSMPIIQPTTSTASTEPGRGCATPLLILLLMALLIGLLTVAG